MEVLYVKNYTKPIFIIVDCGGDSVMTSGLIDFDPDWLTEREGV